MTGFKIIFLAGIEKKFEAGVRGGCPRMPVAKDFFDDAIQIRYITPAIKYLKIVIPAKAGGKRRLRSRNTLDAGSSTA